VGVHTVKQVAKLSGVSVRTLHHYDDLGLLTPASIGTNGYRYYGREELLRLQQILFHRELGFSLQAIGRLLDAPDFDRAAALRAHRKTLAAETRRYRRLVRTIDETLAALEGVKAMDDKAMYRGFDPERQATQEAWIVERYGAAAQAAIDAQKAVQRDWTQADFDQSQAQIGAILDDLAKAMAGALPPESAHVQDLMRQLHDWVARSWVAPPDRTAFVRLADLYEEHPDFRALYEGKAKGLTDYMTEAMRLFAARSLG
jgi:DNA-binding transcriptional MerR regulator